MDDEKIQSALDEIVPRLADAIDELLLAMTPEEIQAHWVWSWQEEASLWWNIYHFADTLELYKRHWEKWEEHHNGYICVVERVAEKYVKPRIDDFMRAMIANTSLKGTDAGHQLLRELV